MTSAADGYDAWLATLNRTSPVPSNSHTTQASSTSGTKHAEPANEAAAGPMSTSAATPAAQGAAASAVGAQPVASDFRSQVDCVLRGLEQFEAAELCHGTAASTGIHLAMQPERGAMDSVHETHGKTLVATHFSAADGMAAMLAGRRMPDAVLAPEAS